MILKYQEGTDGVVADNTSMQPQYRDIKVKKPILYYPQGEKQQLNAAAPILAPSIKSQQDANRVYNEAVRKINTTVPPNAMWMYPNLDPLLAAPMVANQGKYMAEAALGMIPIPLLEKIPALKALGRIGVIDDVAASVLKPVQKFITKQRARNYTTPEIMDRPIDIHDVRNKYHSKAVFLQPEEIELLHKFGPGNPVNYNTKVTDDVLGATYTEDIEPSVYDFFGIGSREELRGVVQPKLDISTRHKPENGPSIGIDKTLVDSGKGRMADSYINTGKTRMFSYRPYGQFQRTSNSVIADDWITSWYEHPTTKKRFLDFGGTEADWENVLNTLENPVKSGYKWGEGQPGGIYNKLWEQASVPVDADIGAIVHEGAHKTKIALGIDGELKKLYNDFTDAIRLDPAESYAEVMRIRYEMGWTPDTKITEEMMKEALRAVGWTHYLITPKVIDRKKLLNLFNTAPSIVLAAAAGTTMTAQ